MTPFPAPHPFLFNALTTDLGEGGFSAFHTQIRFRVWQHRVTNKVKILATRIQLPEMTGPKKKMEFNRDLQLRFKIDDVCVVCEKGGVE